jgi:hypothetical protein
MPSARIELAILSLHTEVILVIRFTTKPRGPEIGIPTLLDWLVEDLATHSYYIPIARTLPALWHDDVVFEGVRRLDTNLAEHCSTI